MRRLGLAALLLPLLLTGCGDDTDSYCDAVKGQQEKLSEIVGSGDAAALLEALGIFTDLQGKAPSDISDEWQQVVSSIEGLRDALDDAGVDPSAYDRAHPPAGLSAEQKKAIDDAAARLGSAETAQALQDLDQQARDVCHTPLSL